MCTKCPDVHVALFNAISAYDKRQSTKKSYNRYALGHYANGLQNVRELMGLGHTVRTALVKNFSGAVLDCLLKSVGEKPGTKNENLL